MSTTTTKQKTKKHKLISQRFNFSKKRTEMNSQQYNDTNILQTHKINKQTETTNNHKRIRINTKPKPCKIIIVIIKLKTAQPSQQQHNMHKYKNKYQHTT